MNKLVALAVFPVLLVACAGPVTLVKDGAGNAEFAADMRQCEYDAVKHGGGWDPTMRSAVGQGLEQAMRQREIKLACMQAKGWRPQ